MNLRLRVWQVGTFYFWKFQNEGNHSETTQKQIYVKYFGMFSYEDPTNLMFCPQISTSRHKLAADDKDSQKLDYE